MLVTLDSEFHYDILTHVNMILWLYYPPIAHTYSSFSLSLSPSYSHYAASTFMGIFGLFFGIFLDCPCVRKYAIFDFLSLA
jgi:hypothetical protein